MDNFVFKWVSFKLFATRWFSSLRALHRTPNLTYSSFVTRLLYLDPRSVITQGASPSSPDQICP
jgi:hypothetical protein